MATCSHKAHKACTRNNCEHPTVEGLQECTYHNQLTKLASSVRNAKKKDNQELYKQLLNLREDLKQHEGYNDTEKIKEIDVKRVKLVKVLKIIKKQGKAEVEEKAEVKLEEKVKKKKTQQEIAKEVDDTSYLDEIFADCDMRQKIADLEEDNKKKSTQLEQQNTRINILLDNHNSLLKRVQSLEEFSPLKKQKTKKRSSSGGSGGRNSGSGSTGNVRVFCDIVSDGNVVVRFVYL
jgi:hypothetical protein